MDKELAQEIEMHNKIVKLINYININFCKECKRPKYLCKRQCRLGRIIQELLED